MKKLILFLIIFSSLLFPKIFSVDMSIIFIFIWFILYSRKIKIDNLMKYSLISFFFVLLISFINYYIYLEIFGLLRAINTLLVFLMTYIFLNKIELKLVFNYVVIVFILAMIIIILEYININDSKEIITSINNIFYTTKDVDYRARGLYPGYASAGLMMGISSFFFFLYAYLSKNNSLYIVMFIALITTIITSRTGFLVGFIGILMLSIYLSLIRFSFKFTIKFVLISILSIIIFIQFVDSIIDYDTLEITLKRFLELYNNYQGSGSISSDSTNELINSYYLPSGIPTFLFGSNLQPWVEGGVSSDVGFIQSWHQFGLIGMMCFYFPFFLLIATKLFIVIKNGKLTFLLYAFLVFDILIIIANLKGNYIYSKGVIFTTLLLHTLALKDYKQKR